MKVASKVKDGRINAVNVLLDMNIKEYLEVAGHIIKNNEFQRKRVKNSSTVYALLKRICEVTVQCLLLFWLLRRKNEPFTESI